MLSRGLFALALLGVGRSARAEAPSPDRSPAPKEDELSAEDREMLEVIDVLWELPLLEEWDPEEDAPDPIGEAPGQRKAPPDAAKGARP